MANGDWPRSGATTVSRPCNESFLMGGSVHNRGAGLGLHGGEDVAGVMGVMGGMLGEA